MQTGMEHDKKRICLVTGGSKGIGAAIVRRLAAQEYRVAINYCRSRLQCELLEKELSDSGLEVLTVQADISQGAQVEEMFADIERTWGPVDCLINNAGVSLYKMLVDTQVEEWQHLMDINLKGIFLCSRRALPHMIKQHWGRLVNISSVWGIYGASCESVYAASKGGVIAFSKSLAAEYGSCGITVNAIAPGAIDTGMTRMELSDEALKQLVEEIPAGRLGDPDEVAAACVFLLSAEAAYINGQVFIIDGGWKLS